MSYSDVKGLSDAEVLASREQHGANVLPPPEVESFWEKLKGNFDDPLIRILCVALGVTFVLAFMGYAKFVEGVGIAVAVFLATFVATYSEYKNESNFQELQAKASKVTSSVFRNGGLMKISVADVVVGDYVLLEAGDRVPADGVVVRGHVGVDQSSLTGEKETAHKVAGGERVLNEWAAGAMGGGESRLSDPHCCFRGSTVDGGDAVMVVMQVGEKTLYGELAVEISAMDTREAPLQTKLARLADGVSQLGYYGAALIALSFLFKQFVMDPGWSWAATVAYASQWQTALHDVVTSLILAIIVVVVAVPEGLPMMIAIVLSFNMRKLLRAQVLVRRLLGIETAGCMDMLFADKTGTLTEGEFTPQVVLSGGTKRYGTYKDLPPTLASCLRIALKGSTKAVLAAHPQGSVVNMSGKRSEGVPLVGGNASDRAMLNFLPPSVLTSNAIPFKRGNEILFSSVHKFSASEITAARDDLLKCFPASAIRDLGDGTAAITIVKGAAEVVTACCMHYYSEFARELIPFDTASSLNAEVDALAGEGMRFIAIATSPEPVSEGAVLPGSLSFMTVVGMVDHVRPESVSAVALAQSAGIHVVMITGDRLETAASIARAVGLLNPGKPSGDRGALLESEQIITSSQLAALSDEEVAQRLPNLRVVARALPTDKSRLVQIAQRPSMASPGHVVGMTGDGINDTAALKKADVSFAMGSGAEIAKEASDIVILNDNFQSILQASLYGRTIFRSIRKFVVFQSTINLASTLIVFLGPFMGFDFPLTLIQLLWVNLVMDTLAALAFGGAPALQRYMKEKPIAREEPIISPAMWSSILVTGSFIAVFCIVFLTFDGVHALFAREVPHEGTFPPAPEDANVHDTAVVETSKEIDVQGGEVFLTAFFCFFIFICTMNAFNVRTSRLNLLDNIAGNPQFVGVICLIFVVQVVMTEFGGSLLRTVPLRMREWVSVLFLSSLVLPFDMCRKWFFVWMAQSGIYGSSKTE